MYIERMCLDDDVISLLGHKQRPVINCLAPEDIDVSRLARRLSVAISARQADPLYDVMQNGR